MRDPSLQIVLLLARCDGFSEAVDGGVRVGVLRINGQAFPHSGQRLVELTLLLEISCVIEAPFHDSGDSLLLRCPRGLLGILHELLELLEVVAVCWRLRDGAE